MTKPFELPPLPGSIDANGWTVARVGHPIGPAGAGPSMLLKHTDDDMRSYALLAVNEALERAAKMCETGVDTPHPTMPEHIMEKFGPSATLAAAIRAMMP